MSDFHRILKANPYRGTGGKFSSKAKATSTKLTTPKQVSKPQKDPAKPGKPDSKMKL